MEKENEKTTETTETTSKRIPLQQKVEELRKSFTSGKVKKIKKNTFDEFLKTEANDRGIQILEKLKEKLEIKRHFVLPQENKRNFVFGENENQKTLIYEFDPSASLENITIVKSDGEIKIEEKDFSKLIKLLIKELTA